MESVAWPYRRDCVRVGQRAERAASRGANSQFLEVTERNMETEEIYDVLMEQLVATIKGYDPKYTEKVKLLVEAIENGLSKRKQFSFADVNRHLDFDCDRYIRLLGRLGLLFSEAQRPAGSMKQLIAGRRPAHRTTF
jgi:hypothetical protein